MIARDRISKLSANLVLLAIGVLFVLPLLWVLFASINRTAGLRVEFPTHLTLGNFKAVLNTDTSYRPVLNGIVLCGGAALLTMICSVLAAYPLSRKGLPGKGLIMAAFVFTMMFSGGLIPTYLVVDKLGLLNTRWAIILPAALAVWNVIITRTYFMVTIPEELVEAGTDVVLADLTVFPAWLDAFVATQEPLGV